MQYQNQSQGAMASQHAPAGGNHVYPQVQSTGGRTAFGAINMDFQSRDAERKRSRKVDSVASLNDIAERDFGFPAAAPPPPPPSQFYAPREPMSQQSYRGSMSMHNTNNMMEEPCMEPYSDPYMDPYMDQYVNNWQQPQQRSMQQQKAFSQPQPLYQQHSMQHQQPAYQHQNVYQHQSMQQHQPAYQQHQQRSLHSSSTTLRSHSSHAAPPAPQLGGRVTPQQQGRVTPPVQHGRVTPVQHGPPVMALPGVEPVPPEVLSSLYPEVFAGNAFTDAAMGGSAYPDSYGYGEGFVEPVPPEALGAFAGAVNSGQQGRRQTPTERISPLPDHDIRLAMINNFVTEAKTAAEIQNFVGNQPQACKVHAPQALRSGLQSLVGYQNQNPNYMQQQQQGYELPNVNDHMWSAPSSSGASPDKQPQQQQSDSDITISFRPKIGLGSGETVQLILGEFDAPSFNDVTVQAIPERSFVKASWVAAGKQLTLTLGADIRADEQVTVLIPSDAGLRRKSPTPTQHVPSYPPQAFAHVRETIVEQPMSVRETIIEKEEEPVRETIVEREKQPAPAPAPVAAPARAVPAEEPQLSAEDEKKKRAAERRAAFMKQNLAKPSPKAPAASATPPHTPGGSSHVGIDIDFVPDQATGGVCITNVHPAGAAWQSGQLQSGDVITCVDKRNLSLEIGADEVRRMLVGPPLSVVQLSVIKKAASGQRQSACHEVSVTRLQSAPSTITKVASPVVMFQTMVSPPEHHEEEPEQDFDFMEIPNPEDIKPVSQAAWAKAMLKQEKDTAAERITKTDVDKRLVADQAKWAKDSLQNLPQHEQEKKFDEASVAEQAKWAKESLENRPQHKAEDKFDAEAVAGQSQWARKNLENLPQQQAEKKFDASAVSQQAQWAKDSLAHKDDGKAKSDSAFDAAGIAAQAAWAKQRLANPAADESKTAPPAAIEGYREASPPPESIASPLVNQRLKPAAKDLPPLQAESVSRTPAVRAKSPSVTPMI